MRLTTISIACVLAVTAFCVAPVNGAQAAAITTLYNTGVNNAGAVLADGTQDTHYSLIQQPGTSYGVRVSSTSGGNSGPNLDSSKSQFIGPNSNSNSDGAAGTYVYRTTFSLAGFSAASAMISGLWSADDQGLDILLNGVSIGLTSQPTWYTTTSFSILSGFVSGMNSLDFVLRNDAGATGLRVQMAGTANVSEPASILLLAMGVGGLVLARRRLGREAGQGAGQGAGRGAGRGAA